jgi:hypothetical protein
VVWRNIPLSWHVSLPSTVRFLTRTPWHVISHVWFGRRPTHRVALRPVPAVGIGGHTHLGISADIGGDEETCIRQSLAHDMNDVHGVGACHCRSHPLQYQSPFFAHGKYMY